jgi:hypothetical protein
MEFVCGTDFGLECVAGGHSGHLCERKLSRGPFFARFKRSCSKLEDKQSCLPLVQKNISQCPFSLVFSRAMQRDVQGMGLAGS